MSKGKIKRAASTLRALEGITFESCLDEGNHCYEINKWLIEVAWEVANKGLHFFYSKKSMKKNRNFKQVLI